MTTILLGISDKHKDETPYTNRINLFTHASTE